ncbi:MAG: hypothetical protein M5R41_04090 [Bacteroidia bacterium]|nr:hypothetical protein [Bacteroidia bacterium]
MQVADKTGGQYLSVNVQMTWHDFYCNFSKILKTSRPNKKNRWTPSARDIRKGLPPRRRCYTAASPKATADVASLDARQCIKGMQRQKGNIRIGIATLDIAA